MPSKRGRIPSSFGKFSKLENQKINEIHMVAKATACAYLSNDEKSYSSLIELVNNTLSKHETGIFTGLLIMEARSGIS